MARSYVCAYYDWSETLALCSDAEFGRLVRAALLYARDGISPAFPDGSREALYWNVLCAQLERDISKYDKRAKAGRAGMAARWKKQDPEPPPDGNAAVADMKAFIASMDTL